jgi:hypothetical protein
MKKGEKEVMKIVGMVVCIFAFAFFQTPACYSQSQQEERSVRTMIGHVASMDWVASILVINTGGDETTLIVPAGTKITEGSDSISFSDINLNDNVTIQYYDAGLAGLKTVRITVHSSPN